MDTDEVNIYGSCVQADALSKVEEAEVLKMNQTRSPWTTKGRTSS